MTDSKFLNDADPGRYFNVNDGTVIRNMYELVERLGSMSKETFDHHLTPERNDFSNWINDVLGDKELSERLVDVKSRDEFITIIKDRIEFLSGHDNETVVKEEVLEEASAPAKYEPEEEEDLTPIHPSVAAKKDDSHRMTSGLMDFLGGIALGIIIGLFLARLLF